jgi:hypothetical protein
VKKKFVMSLTPAEISFLRAIPEFVEAGEVDDRPLDAETPQQCSANLRVFGSLCDRVLTAAKK